MGSGDQQSRCCVGTPPRKIRAKFQEHKHTSLTYMTNEACEVRLAVADNETPNVWDAVAL
jgi:hypothetical protein